MKLCTFLVALVAALVSAQAAFAQNATISVTVRNNLSFNATPGTFNYAGTLAPTPASPLGYGASDIYVNTSSQPNITSFHVTYSSASGGKSCRFDGASYWTVSSLGSGYCTFTKNATSTGSTRATCGATITSTNSTNCSFAVTYTIQ